MTMLKNHNHDLVKQLSEDSSSLWRYDTYVKNSKGCQRCTKMWKGMKATDAKKVKVLKDEIERHVKEGKFN